MRIAYADPPYPGQSKKHYGDHPDYAGEVDHDALARQLGTFDGWVLHTSAVAQYDVETSLLAAGLRYRVGVWVKPFAAVKKGVIVTYAWEPVIFSRARPQVRGGGTMTRDWIAEPITMMRGLVGVKPDAVILWALRMVGAERTDDIDDLFPGSGAVGRAIDGWRAQGSINDLSRPAREIGS